MQEVSNVVSLISTRGGDRRGHDRK